MNPLAHAWYPWKVLGCRRALPPLPAKLQHRAELSPPDTVPVYKPFMARTHPIASLPSLVTSMRSATTSSVLRRLCPSLSSPLRERSTELVVGLFKEEPDPYELSIPLLLI